MKLQTLEAHKFKEMILAGAERLEKNAELINSLNVFPVPDGDTGTNMKMTFNSGADYVRQSSETHVGELAQVLAKGLLMGARGNSGVILSQIFRGFSKAIAKENTLSASTFAKAFVGGVESAYKAVMKPVEGTILTVARESALAGEEKATETDDIIEVLEAIVTEGAASLERTPDLLPVLKQVGVVDSGGKGLLTIYEGFLAVLKGEAHIESTQEVTTEHVHAAFDNDEEHPISMDDITFGYCTEIMVRIGENPSTDKTFDYEDFRNTLNDMGDSLLVVADDEIIKVHVHTEDPGQVMRLGQEYGELVKIKVDNMREQVRELDGRGNAKAAPAVPAVEHKSYALVSVAAGEGMVELLKEMGVDQVLEGGQTMNPSTQDFVEAMEKVSADHIIILPNNKNIVMAAEQAASVSEVPTIVVKSTTLPEGITSLLGFNPDASIEENEATMIEMMGSVSTGQVTYAIRDTEIDNILIKKDDFMGLIDGKIVVSTPSIEDTVKQTLLQMINEDTEIVTVYVGEDGDADYAEGLADELMDDNDMIDVEVVQGNQPVYNYIFSVE
ncbi:DAK2 domain-containing protein [Aerococcaceae bacterium DSM 111022]|nr:DAK2 domain-containing protein [Aerococcaceae bacterium DSM 111022]